MLHRASICLHEIAGGAYRQHCQHYASIIRAAFSPIMIDGAFVLPEVSVGMIEASATRSPARPRTRSWSSTTAIEPTPILQVPTGW
jgi:hypothetical protein